MFIAGDIFARTIIVIIRFIISVFISKQRQLFVHKNYCKNSEQIVKSWFFHWYWRWAAVVKSSIFCPVGGSCAHMHEHMHKWIHTCTKLCASSSTCTHARAHTYTHTHTHTHQLLYNSSVATFCCWTGAAWCHLRIRTTATESTHIFTGLYNTHTRTHAHLWPVKIIS